MTGIRVLSYNVRYANRDDHHDAWHDRRDAVARLVRFHRPDVVAFQEPTGEQRRDLRERLPGYAFVGRGRDADGDGEGCPIAARSDRWAIVDEGTFWLSKTPAEPSTGWDAAHPRIATWVRIRSDDGSAETVDTTGGSGTSTDVPELLVVNAHFDHVSARARRGAARLLRERLPELAADTGRDADERGRRSPLVFVGDLNCTSGSDPHRILLGDDPASADGVDGADRADGRIDGDECPLRDAAEIADLRYGPTTSLTDFARLIDGRRIDHAFVSPGIDVEAFATLADRDDRGRYPSDHLPILSRLEV